MIWYIFKLAPRSGGELKVVTVAFQASVSTMDFQIRNFQRRSLSISKFGHGRVTQYVQTEDVEASCGSCFWNSFLFVMVVKHSKFVWPLSLGVSTNVGHCYSDNEITWPLCRDYENIPRLSDTKINETTCLLCCDHEMQTLCYFVNKEQPLNEGASTAVIDASYHVARSNGKDCVAEETSEREMLDGRSRYHFTWKGKINRKRARESSRILLRKVWRLLRKNKHVRLKVRRYISKFVPKSSALADCCKKHETRVNHCLTRHIKLANKSKIKVRKHVYLCKQRPNTKHNQSSRAAVSSRICKKLLLWEL